MRSGPAIVLLSGGLDSATAAAVARARGHALHALTVRYGQRHACELEAALRVARALGVRDHRIVELDLGWVGGSALTADLPVPKRRAEIGGDVPSTYVPARNTLLLGLALAWADAMPAHDVFIGVSAVDSSGYPDCRPAFVAAFERLASVATREGAAGRPIRIHAPLIRLTKAETIRLGLEHGLDYGLTHSCYDPAPDGGACGGCDACVLRRRGFAEAGVPDPTRYA